MINRRVVIAGALAGTAGAARGTIAGDGLFDDVARYASFGDKRSGEAGDRQTSAWIAQRLAAAGYHIDRQPFAVAATPHARAILRAGDRSVLLFPVWPVAVTPEAGIAASLGDGEGRIALVDLPYAPNASLLTPGYGEPLWRAATSGAAAVIGVTRGPTGDVIALNAVPSRYRWPVPTAVIGEHYATLLAAGMATRLTISGVTVARTAANIVATRAGTGKAVVVSTPTSGWFECAGERGTGVALFLMLASWAARSLSSPLIFLATSGHETEGEGSAAVLAGSVPLPSEVGLWLHLGANVAVLDPEFGIEGVRRGNRPPAARGISASPTILSSVAAAFAGQPGYERPRSVDAASAVGDIAHYVRAGYAPVVGLVGASGLHHTRLDTPELATSPAILASLVLPLQTLLMGVR